MSIVLPAASPTALRRKQVMRPALRALSLLSLLLLAMHHALRSGLAPGRPVLVAVTHGGVGNQIYFLLEAMLLSRHANLQLLPPTIPARNLPNSPHRAHEQPAHRFWHVSRWQPFVTLAPHAPNACRAGLTHVFLVRRHFGVLEPSNRLMRTACLYSRQAHTHRTERHCAERALNSVAVHKMYLNFSTRGDHLLIHRLRKLRRGCVAVDGHSFSHSGHPAHEYVHSALHHVESTPHIKQMLRTWSAPRMTVLHLRYDEYLCNAHNPNVCIRSTLAANRNHTMAYVPQAQLVKAVVQLMRAKNSSSIYIAASPYTPPAIVSGLDNSLSRHANVIPRVSGWDESMHNFLERELATQAHVFVGDVASTWSGTVHYKRRTLGRTTVWSCALVNKCGEIGYYAQQHRLARPEWFEQKYAFNPSW